ncbi:zinc-ribbon domain-containing protein [Listeria monocytogenes]|nr:zinc-ribbon domain-containing protein [Listeria monocytogenes]
MDYCSNCGNQIEENAKFCSGCGTPVQKKQESKSKEETLLTFSTYNFGLENASKGGLSIPQEKYTLTTQRLIIEQKGIMSSKSRDVELYLVESVTVEQKMKDKMLGIGNITIKMHKTPTVTLKRIKDPQPIREEIRKQAHDRKEERNITYVQKL